MRPIVIAAGGTGGHFFPAEALAAELISRGRRVVLMTDARAKASAVFDDHDRHVIAGAGIAGRGVVRGMRATGGLALGVAQARAILSRLRPGAVVGFGGYPSVAPVLAARSLRPRPAIVLHEQNAVLGRANRFLAKRADLLALSFPGTSLVPSGISAQIVGNPVRNAIHYVPYAPPAGPIHLLVLGGSLGARIFSDVVPPALASLPDDLRTRLLVTQQCRAEDIDRVRTAYAAAGIAATLNSFFADIASVLAGAHLVIARAGASTVAELAVAGRPAILVPLPGAIDDHQSANAKSLADHGGAFVMAQPVFTSDALASRLKSLLTDPATLENSAAAALAQARGKHAVTELADAVEARASQETQV